MDDEVCDEIVKNFVVSVKSNWEWGSMRVENGSLP
jgi:hypothetical protein